MKERIIKGDLKTKKYILNSSHIALNKEIAIGRYNYLVNTMKVNSNRILLFTLNRAQSLQLKDSVNYTSISSINISSYFSFVQQELKKYWSLILKDCIKIKKKKVRPVFMTFEASQNLMGKLVSHFREKGELNELSMIDEEIAQKTLSNLSILAFSNQNYLLYSKYMERCNLEDVNFKSKTYESLNKLINMYVERVLEEGVVDYALSMYLYSNYLLKNDLYLSSLKNRFDYLIVDKGELMNPCQVDFINTIEGSLEELCILYNPNGAYGIYMQNESYIESELLSKYFNIYIEKENELLDTIEKNILYDKDYQIESSRIFRNFEFDMNIEVARCLLKDLDRILKVEGSLEGITIITPSRDIALEYILSTYSQKRNIDFYILNRNERIIDNKYINALSIFALLYYSFDNLQINIDELRVFLVVFLETNLIKADLIAKYINNTKSNIDLIEINDKKLLDRLDSEILEKYEDLRGLLNELKSSKLDIDEFFKEIYLRYYLKNKLNKELIKQCKNLIESAISFLEVVSLFQGIKDVNMEFLRFMRDGAKENESIEQIKERVFSKGLILSSPISYINYQKESKKIFLLDIRNNLWVMNSVNIIQNPYILTKGWDVNKRYTLDKHEELERHTLNNTIKHIISSVKEDIYIYAHKYSSYGIEMNSIMYRIFSNSP